MLSVSRTGVLVDGASYEPFTPPDGRAAKEMTTEQGPDPVLLEREAEIEQLTSALADAREGAGSLTVIEGEAGIGKTRLLDEARRIAGGELDVLAARGFELEQALPFGVVLQLLAPRIRGLGQAERARLLSGGGAHAAALLTGAGPRRGPDELPVLNALYWVLADLSDRGPLLVCVDDLHWADEPSLRFLAFLAPRLTELAIAAVVAIRTGEPAGAGAVATIASTPGAHRLRPPALSTAACTAIVRTRFGEDAPGALGAACHRSVNGNPFLLSELLNELRREDLQPGAQTSRAIAALGPASISRAVLVRLARLPEGAIGLAESISILGDGSELRQAARLAEVDQDRASTVADALAGAAIIAPRRRLEFIHPIIRQAIYDDLPRFRRAAMHLRAARILDGEDAPADQVASHLLRADPAGEEWVVSALRAAAREALGHAAPSAAVNYLERALAEPPPPETRLHVLYELGAAAARAGQPRAIDALVEPFRLAADPWVKARAGLALCELLVFWNRGPEAAALIEDAIAAGRAQPKLLPRLYAALMWISHQSPPCRRAVGGALTELTDALTADAAPPPLLAYLAEERALDNGTATQARDLARRALHGSDVSAELPADAPAVYMAAGALVLAGDLTEADTELQVAMTAARARGTVPGLILSFGWRALVSYRRGQLLEAESDARTALELSRARQVADIIRPMASGTLVLALIDRGELDRAAEVAAEADHGDDPGLLHLQVLRAALATLHLARRSPEEAIDALNAVARWERDLGAATGRWVAWRPLAALAHLALEARDEARALVDQELELAQRFGAPAPIGVALRVRGLVEGGSEGVELLEESVTTLGRSQARLEHARSLIELGAALRRVNRRADARNPLRAGLDLAVRCNAAALADQARDELRATGARPRRALLSGVESLTPSEHRAAKLAAGGMTNREVAQALFVTMKTVETHLGHVYSKLDTTRAGLPDALGLEATGDAAGRPRRLRRPNEAPQPSAVLDPHRQELEANGWPADLAPAGDGRAARRVDRDVG